MKYTIIALPALLLMAALPSSKTTRMDNKDAGWVSLFDGKTTKGWHTYGKPSADPQWEVRDGAIHLAKSKGGGGDLLTDREYGNFDLKLEWKISPKGNSGILFHVHEDPAKYEEAYYTGPEMQVLDNNGHSDGKIHKHRAGDLYDLIPCTKETVRPVGEWNEAEIISKNGSLKLFLNGVNVVSTTMWDDQWKTLVAGSKFKQWPDFGSFRRGKIDLQDHGNEVWYRNIKIKEL
ncbi:MAG TPA: DUF1080 domain-containing protein [Puia sp.]|nr:DUF1080 domain-containing protein [Puia sp.]